MTRLATSALIFAVGLSMFVMASASAWALVQVAAWAWDLLGPWLLLLVALVIGDVGRREMRRAR